MSIRTSDVYDLDFVDAYELASDGYTVYLTSTLVSTTSGTKTVVINLPFDGIGILYSHDHPAESGDIVRLNGTSGGAADGYYTIDTIVTDTSFTVRETIASSTGGTIDFIYPSGASRVGFDTTGAIHITHKNVQGALHDLDISITAGSVTMTEIEIDFGSMPTRTKTFTIIDVNVTPISKLIINQAGTAATGRQFDENEMDPILFSGVAGSGQFTLIANALTGPVTGKFKVNYVIG